MVDSRDSRWTQRDISQWAESKFGVGSPLAIAIRGNKEMSELISCLFNEQEPHKAAEECADVAIFLFQVCQRLGFDLLEEVDIKMDINEGRTWKKADDGSFQHVD